MRRIDHHDKGGLRIRTGAGRPADDEGYGVGAWPGVRVRQDIGRRISDPAVAKTPEPIRERTRRGVRERHGQRPRPEGWCRAKTGDGCNGTIATDGAIDPGDVRRDARAVKPARTV